MMATPERPHDWGVSPAGYPSARKAALLAPCVAGAVAVGAVAWLLSNAAVAVAVVAAIAVAAALTGPASLVRWRLRGFGARPHHDPRLENLVEGVSRRVGAAPPRLLVVDGLGPNALIAPDRKGAMLVVTRALVETFTRTEIEAVIAHCLVRVADGHLAYAALASSGWGSALAPRVGRVQDVRAAAITRYPPALASAIAKADPGVRKLGPLWFVWDGPSHEPASERVEALERL